MFSRSHNSKNSGGALASHLFNRRLLPKPTSSATSPDSHPQSVRKPADVPVASTPTGGARRRQDAYDDPSPVQLLSVRRNTSEQSTSPPEHVESSVGPRGRRGKLGLSVAVVRGPSTMDCSSSGSSATSSMSADVSHDQRDLSTVNHNHHRDSDASLNLATVYAIDDVQNMKQTGEYVTPTKFVIYFAEKHFTFTQEIDAFSSLSSCLSSCHHIATVCNIESYCVAVDGGQYRHFRIKLLFQQN